VQVPVPAIPQAPPVWRFWLAIAAAVLAVAGLALWLRPWRTSTIVDRFWDPILSDPGPVLFSMGEARVFSFDEPMRTKVRNEADAYFKAGRPMDKSYTDLLPLFDRYVPIGDSICLARLVSLVQQHGKVYRVRGGSSTSLADLRDGTGVLIGAFTNNWTLRLTEGLRFTMEFDSKGNFGLVRDLAHPENDRWKAFNPWPEPQSWTDYGVVSRIRHPATGKIILTAAGISRCATSAAGELLTSPESLSEAIKLAPEGWEKKNIQIVFSTPVVNGNAGPPKPLAVHVW
jgi:hypothetical protein